VVVAALASIASPRPTWVLDAVWPGDAPHSTPAGTKGLLLTITATATPTVECAIAGSDYQLEPLPGGTGRYLCPPGGTIRLVKLTGNAAGGCCKPDPPGDQAIRIDRVEVVETWSVVVTTHVRTSDDGYERAGLVHTASPYQPFAIATFAAPPTRSPKTSVYDRNVRIVVDRADREDVEVVLTIYGPCAAQPCTAPSDAKVELR
jgi:hypothetical protein